VVLGIRVKTAKNTSPEYYAQAERNSLTEMRYAVKDCMIEP
jgi:hypothetical protein